MKEMMKTEMKILLLLVFATLLGCAKDDDPQGGDTQILSYDFSTNAEGWTGDFADYPEGEEQFYELEFSHTTLPAPLNETEGVLKLSGNNHSDDLFMFIKKEITGLIPNQEYQINFEVQFATNVADGQFGIGGSPGESVYIKVGAAPIEPQKELDDMGFYRMNIDKNNQSQSGEDMIVIGDFSNDTEENVYTLKTLSNDTPFSATANSNGSLWIIVGTESGFEGATTIYYDRIAIELF